MLYVQSTLRELPHHPGLELQIGPCCSCIWIWDPQLDNCVLISSPRDPFSSRAASKENKFYFCLCIARYLISLPPVFLSLCSLFFPLLFVRRLRPVALRQRTELSRRRHLVILRRNWQFLCLFRQKKKRTSKVFRVVAMLPCSLFWHIKPYVFWLRRFLL